MCVNETSGKEIMKLDRCTHRTTVCGLSLITFIVMACGGAADSGRVAEPTIDYGGGPPKRARRGGMNVSGIMGTINTNINVRQNY